MSSLEHSINPHAIGRDRCPPGMMLGLLIYCYATSTSSIRCIERLPDAGVACGQGHAGVGLDEDHRRRQQSSSETNPTKTPDKIG